MSTLKSKLDEITERAKKATPGRWRAEWNGSGVNLKVGPGEGFMIGTLDTEWCEQETPLIDAEEIEANGELFAHAKQDIQSLLAVIEKLIEQRDAAYRELFDASRAVQLCESGDRHALAALTRAQEEGGL